MASRISFSFLAIALLLGVTSADFDEEAVLASVSFSYSGATGPDYWGSLSPLFSACSSGKKQSPVNILKNETILNKNLKPLVRNYYPAKATLANNGFNIGMHYDASVGAVVIDGKSYNLKQMHWHSPSEHRIDGVQYPVELHLVHQAADGNFSVVAILFDIGDPDPLLSKIKDYVDELAKEVCEGNEVAQIPVGTLDTKLLRRNTRKYYRYIGSLTTPPCTENVTWNILGKVRSISKEQVEALKAPLDSAYKNNSRPLQQLNERKVELYNELGD